jgi:hypothetical protein
MTVGVEVLEASCDCLQKIADRVCADFGGKRDGPVVTVRTQAPFGTNRTGIMAIPVAPMAFVFERPLGGEVFRIEPAFCQHCGAKRVKPAKVKVTVSSAPAKKSRKKLQQPVIDVPATPVPEEGSND